MKGLSPVNITLHEYLQLVGLKDAHPNNSTLNPAIINKHDRDFHIEPTAIPIYYLSRLLRIDSELQ